MNVKFSKLDRVLLVPIYNVLFGQKTSLAYLFRYCSKRFKDINSHVDQNASGFLRFLYRVFSFLLWHIFIFALLFILWLVLTIVICSFFLTVSTVVVLAIGLFYGLCPFVIKDIPYNGKTIKNPDTSKDRGLNVLLIPLKWTFSFNRRGINYTWNLGLRPFRKFNTLGKLEETYVLNRVSYFIGGLIAFVIYSLIACGIVTLLLSFCTAIIAIICVSIWSILNAGRFVGIFLKNLFVTTGNTDEKEDE